VNSQNDSKRTIRALTSAFHDGLHSPYVFHQPCSRFYANCIVQVVHVINARLVMHARYNDYGVYFQLLSGFRSQIYTSKTRGSAIAEEPRVSGTLHWRLSKWIVCSWTV